MQGSDQGDERRRMQRTNEVAYQTKRLMRGDDIGFDAAKQSMSRLMHKEVNALDANFGAFFGAMTAKGPTKDEILGCTEAVLEVDAFNMKQIELDTEESVYSICGSGKTDFKMFNISTTAAFVASAADVTVTKQGSYGTSKSTGAADAVELLGANLNGDIDRMIASGEEDSIGFFTIEDKVANYDDIYGGNFYIYHPLSYGFAGLINKVQLDGIVYGTMTEDTELVAEILQEYGFDNSIVVNAEIEPDRLVDEFSIFGETKYSVIRGDSIETVHDDFSDLTDAIDPATIRSGRRAENARALLSVVDGTDDGPKTDVTCLNAGAVLYAADEADSIRDGTEICRQKIADGSAYEQLRRLVENSGGDLDLLREKRQKLPMAD